VSEAGMISSFTTTLHEGAMTDNEVKQVNKPNFPSCPFYSINAPDRGSMN